MDIQSRQAYLENQENLYEDGNGEGSDDERKYVKKRASYHPSNIQGAFIVNAITGIVYPWRVGTTDARRLFRTVDTSGTHDKLGRKLRPNSPNYPNPNPNHYYYDSPQQFMQHRKMKLNSEIVEGWQATQQEFVVVKDNQ